MIERGLTTDSDAPIVVVDIGNSSTSIATWHKGEVRTPLSIPTDDQGAFSEAFGKAFAAQVDATPAHRVASVVVASVVPEALKRVRSFLGDERELNALVVGDTVPFPIEVAVKDVKALGVDRV